MGFCVAVVYCRTSTIKIEKIIVPLSSKILNTREGTCPPLYLGFSSSSVYISETHTRCRRSTKIECRWRTVRLKINYKLKLFDKIYPRKVRRRTRTVPQHM